LGKLLAVDREYPANII